MVPPWENWVMWPERNAFRKLAHSLREYDRFLRPVRTEWSPHAVQPRPPPRRLARLREPPREAQRPPGPRAAMCPGPRRRGSGLRPRGGGRGGRAGRGRAGALHGRGEERKSVV